MVGGLPGGGGSSEAVRMPCAFSSEKVVVLNAGVTLRDHCPGLVGLPHSLSFSPRYNNNNNNSCKNCSRGGGSLVDRTLSESPGSLMR